MFSQNQYSPFICHTVVFNSFILIMLDAIIFDISFASSIKAFVFSLSLTRLSLINTTNI